MGMEWKDNEQRLGFAMTAGILGNLVSVHVLTRTATTRFCNLLIMLAYVDIRSGRDMELG